MRNAARIGHELTEIREIFSHDGYKQRPVHASGHQFQNECSS